jgi:hypothetical protein
VFPSQQDSPRVVGIQQRQPFPGVTHDGVLSGEDASMVICRASVAEALGHTKHVE